MANPVVHFEIGCRDSAATQEFFSQLFGWNIAPMGPAAMIDTGQIPGVSGIAGHITSLGHEPHNYVTVYVQVDDLEAYMAKAVELGGKRLVEPVTIPMGSFAWIADREGTVIGLWKTA
jgi:predicted enzyme related to lactoylglutathione lyase